MIVNLILPVFFNNTNLIPYVSLFLIPAILLMSYGIFKYKLFDTRIILLEIATYMLWIMILIRLLVSENSHDYLLSGSLLLVAISFGTLLIVSISIIRRQRETITSLDDKLDLACNELKKIDKILTKHESSIYNPIRKSNR